MTTNKRPRPQAFGNARTQKEIERERRIEHSKLPGTKELIKAYVLITHKGEVHPCPDIERAKEWAQQHGTIEHPVTVHKHGITYYRWPE